MRKIAGVPLHALGIRRAYIALSGASVAEDASVGDTVGTLSVVGATGTPSFTLVDDASGKFSLTGSTLKVAGALDYETATSHNITVSVSGVTPSIANTSFTILVTDVEPEYSPAWQFNDYRNSQYLIDLLVA